MNRLEKKIMTVQLPSLSYQKPKLTSNPLQSNLFLMLTFFSPGRWTRLPAFCQVQPKSIYKNQSGQELEHWKWLPGCHLFLRGQTGSHRGRVLGLRRRRDPWIRTRSPGGRCTYEPHREKQSSLFLWKPHSVPAWCCFCSSNTYTQSFLHSFSGITICTSPYMWDVHSALLSVQRYASLHVYTWTVWGTLGEEQN